MKPSNILSIGNNSKLGDLGRSLCLSTEVECPYSLSMFNGDWTYAPPEAFLTIDYQMIKKGFIKWIII